MRTMNPHRCLKTCVELRIGTYDIHLRIFAPDTVLHELSRHSVDYTYSTGKAAISHHVFTINANPKN